jgi:hypothetical protein
VLLCPGAAERAFEFDATAEKAWRPRRRRHDRRFAACLGDQMAVGAVRASLGIANNAGDVSRAVALIESFADE